MTRSVSHGPSCAHNAANNEHGRLELDHGRCQIIAPEWGDLRGPLKAVSIGCIRQLRLI